MVTRYPTAYSSANSTAKLTLQFRRNNRLVSFEMGSVASFLLAAICAVLMAWYLVATCYLVFRDDMLAKLLSNQAETQYAYEDRIAALRSHLDRVATRQLAGQDSFEERVNELVARQSQLETRQAIVSALAAEARRQGLRQPELPARPANAPSAEITGSIGSAFKPPLPAGGPLIPTLRPAPSDGGKRASLFNNSVPGLRLGQNSNDVAAISSNTTDRVATGLVRVEQNQLVAVTTLEKIALEKVNIWRSAVLETGLNQRRFGIGTSASSAQGGPLVAIATGSASQFDQSVVRLQQALNEAARVASVSGALPVSRPLSADAQISSTFGARSDPFLHSAAMHTGIDFRATYGRKVEATASGKIITAGPTGGYGNMVEIDHGFGLSTRYAHLSSISVDVGDTIARGEIVGLVGSTGRSTGPHLHYETRIDGEAVDPMRFLQVSGRMLR